MNTTIAQDLLYNKTLADLMDRALSSKVTLYLAPIACAIDLLIVYTIWRTKELHSKSHLVMLSLSMAHAIYASQIIIWCAVALVRIRDSSPLILSSWLCILVMQSQVYSYNAFRALGLNLAIDRFMCVVTPIFYRQIDTKKYIIIINILAYTYNIFITLISVMGTDIYAPYGCENPVIASNAVGTIYQSGITSNVRAVFLAVFYGSTACVLMYRYKKANLSGSTQKSEWRRQWEIRVFTAMCTCGTVSILMRLSQSIPYYLSFLQTNASLSAELKLVTRLLGYLEGMTHLVIYLAIDKGFRLGFRQAVVEKILRSNAVLPMESNGRS